MFHLDPQNDGVDHINIASRAATEVGRKLTNFYRHPLNIQDLGVFYSIEGLWYWLWTDEIIKHYQAKGLYDFDARIKPMRDQLLTASGVNAKQLGRDIIKLLPEAPHHEASPEFRKRICEAIKLKVRTIPGLMEDLRATYPKPLFHYYVFGKDPKNLKVVIPERHPWLIEFLNKYRDELVVGRGLKDPPMQFFP